MIELALAGAIVTIVKVVYDVVNGARMHTENKRQRKKYHWLQMVSLQQVHAKADQQQQTLSHLCSLSEASRKQQLEHNNQVTGLLKLVLLAVVFTAGMVIYHHLVARSLAPPPLLSDLLNIFQLVASSCYICCGWRWSQMVSLFMLLGRVAAVCWDGSASPVMAFLTSYADVPFAVAVVMMAVAWNIERTTSTTKAPCSKQHRNNGNNAYLRDVLLLGLWSLVLATSCAETAQLLRVVGIAAYMQSNGMAQTLLRGVVVGCRLWSSLAWFSQASFTATLLPMTASTLLAVPTPA